jgi:dipeptidyl aminopeptidase/acylaminoacyl peptidase
VLNVWLAPISTGEGVRWDAARVVTDDADRGIRQFAWAHNGHHLLYLQDTGGDENWRLHDVDLRTMTRRDLTPFDDVQTELIGMEREFPDEILVGLNKDNPQLHDVYRLDLRTGELAKELANPGFIGMVADAQLGVRAAAQPQPDGGMVIVVRDNADSADWRPVLTVPAEDALSTGPIAFSKDGGSLLLLSSVGTEAARLVRLDLASGASEVLAEDPQADVSAVRINPDTREPQIVTFLRARSEYQVLDPSVARHLDAIRALNPGDPVFTDADDADQVWLVAFTNDAGPVNYYAYDTATSAAASCSSTSRNWLNTSSRPWSRSPIRPATG